MTLYSNIEFKNVMDKNQYPDNTSKRLHLKGIEEAQDYLERKRNWLCRLLCL